VGALEVCARGDYSKSDKSGFINYDTDNKLSTLSKTEKVDQKEASTMAKTS
jgi:hypothetical protein